MVLHQCFITQKNPNIYILTILILHTAGKGKGLERRRDRGVVGGKTCWTSMEVVAGDRTRKDQGSSHLPSSFHTQAYSLSTPRSPLSIILQALYSLCKGRLEGIWEAKAGARETRGRPS